MRLSARFVLDEIGFYWDAMTALKVAPLAH